MIDLDKLVAGPELDALVAEKVMGLRLDGVFPIQQHEAGGWDPLDENDGIPLAGYQKKPTYRTCGDHPMPPFEYKHGSTCRRVVPEYSIDIAAAWEVVEKVRAARFNLLLDMTWGHQGILAFARERIHEVKVEGGSVPLAICRAALKAVGI